MAIAHAFRLTRDLDLNGTAETFAFMCCHSACSICVSIICRSPRSCGCGAPGPYGNQSGLASADRSMPPRKTRLESIFRADGREIGLNERKGGAPRRGRALIEPVIVFGIRNRKCHSPLQGARDSKRGPLPALRH